MPSAGNRGAAGLAELRCWPRTTARSPVPATELVTPSADRADAPAATHSRPRNPAGQAPAHPAPRNPAARQIDHHTCGPERWAPKEDDGRAERRILCTGRRPALVAERDPAQSPRGTCRV